HRRRRQAEQTGRGGEGGDEVAPPAGRKRRVRLQRPGRLVEGHRCIGGSHCSVSSCGGWTDPDRSGHSLVRQLAILRRLQGTVLTKTWETLDRKGNRPLRSLPGTPCCGGRGSAGD